MEHGWGINGREQILEVGDLKAPLHLQNRPLTAQGRIRVIWDEWRRCKFLELWRKLQVGSSMSMACLLFIPGEEGRSMAHA